MAQTAWSELASLVARLEAAVDRLAARQAAAARALDSAQAAHAADRARLQRIESAANEAIAALDRLIAAEPGGRS